MFLLTLSILILTTFNPNPTQAQELNNLQPQTVIVQSKSKEETTKYQEEKLKLEKLNLEVEKLKLENRKNNHEPTWQDNLINTLSSNASAIITLFLGLIGLLRYVSEQDEERKKKEDESFERMITNLGSTELNQRNNAAILLYNFLDKKYKRFHIRVFQLAAGNLKDDLGENLEEQQNIKKPDQQKINKDRIFVTVPEGDNQIGIRE